MGRRGRERKRERAKANVICNTRVENLSEQI